MGAIDVLKSLFGIGRDVELGPMRVEGGMAIGDDTLGGQIVKVDTVERALTVAASQGDTRAAALMMSLKSLSLADAAPRSAVGRAQWSSWSIDKAIRTGLKRSTWVYACVFRLAKAASSVGWYAEVKTADGWVRDDEHPLSKLMRAPNPNWSRTDFVERIVYSLYLGGEAFVTKVRALSQVRHMWVHNADRVAVYPGGEGEDLIKKYEYKDGGKVYEIDPTDMIHIMFPDPASPYRGLSPLQVAHRLVQTDAAATDWNFGALQNRAVADGAFVAAHEIGDEQYQFMRHIVREQHMGYENARAPWVLGSDMKWVPMSLSPVDMDFLNGRRMTREEICAIYGVPPVLVGILDAATYSNYETARDVFWVDTVVPLLDDLREAFTRGLAVEFGDSVRIAYDASSIEALQKIDMGRVDAAAKLFAMGVPLSELNQRFGLGLGDVEGGDIPWVGGVPIINGVPTPIVGAAASGADAIADALARDVAEQRRALLVDAHAITKRLGALYANIKRTGDADKIRRAERLELELDEILSRLE